MMDNLYNFLLLLLPSIVIINIIMLPTEKPVSNTMPSTYSSSTVAHAQQQKEQPIARTQEWIDKQSNTKVLFAYIPEKPLVGEFTELMFDIEDLKTGTRFKDIVARVTIIDVLQLQQQRKVEQQVPLKSYNVTAPEGHFSIKYLFAHEGTYQIIVKVNSSYSALALASFKIVVPFQPFGVFNINYVFPLLIYVMLVGIIGAIGILAFIIVDYRKQK